MLATNALAKITDCTDYGDDDVADDDDDGDDNDGGVDRDDDGDVTNACDKCWHQDSPIVPILVTNVGTRNPRLHQLL